MRALLSLLSLVVLLWAPCGMATAAALRHEKLDDFHDAAAWQASASDQVQAALRRDRDGSLCLDYDFGAVSGYAVMRRRLPLQWPAHFDLGARLKARGAVNDFQFKLVDASGDNVWWINRPNAQLPPTLADIRLRQRQLDFAWGPTPDRTLRQTEFVEFVVAAGRDGGRGSLCLAALSLHEREADPDPWPEARVTATASGADFDFVVAREFNGLALHWPAGAAAPAGLDYDVLASDDLRSWRLLRSVRGSDGGLDALWLPESEARALRIQRLRGSGRPGLELRSAGQWPDFNAVLSALAADAPRGDMPRAFVGEQNYWTLVGVDGGGGRSGLLSEDGAIEVGRGGYSIEPSVQLDDGSRITWSQVEIGHSLREGYLPMPEVQWRHAAFTLDIAAAADGPRGAPELLARYTLSNTDRVPHSYLLMLALRPWQVNPPQQFLNTPGGARAIERLRWTEPALAVNNLAPLRFADAPLRVGALPFDGGLGLAALQDAPGLGLLIDPQASASVGLQYRFTLQPGAVRVLGWAALLGPRAGMPAVLAPGRLEPRIEAVAQRWRERLNRVQISVPGDGERLVQSLRTALAQILISRDGPELRPGTRAYARSWIRDGAMMVAGLVRLGEVDAAREFVDWFGDHVFDSGKVPCCVDQRGADPVVENDSPGQYLYAVAEVWRHTQDRGFLQHHWPRVQRVTAWMEALRQSERGAGNRRPERAHLFGLLPPSISHEGYADKPAYAYWDDFWALRGYKDAVLMASALGQSAQVEAWTRARDEFQRELGDSILASAAYHRIAWIAGAADRGDFDPTSTTIALHPAQAVLDPALLEATFERYWQEASERGEGRREWKDYTPYELRNVGALTRLGRPERAHALLDFFFKDQRPAGWNQWAEVVLPEAREQRFLGDMPHAWVASDYIRSVLELFAYEREAEGTIVLGAGLKAEWLEQGDIEVHGLSTPYGGLDWRLARTEDGWALELPRALDGPRGGLRLAWPGMAEPPAASSQGRALAWEGRELPLPAAPATVVLRR